jgi:PhzF family phenazine biosynthesis protein
MNPTLFHANAFTKPPLLGNPAGVCLLDEAQPDAWMQALATQLNHPVTAFVTRRADAFDIRWFTPLKEDVLCGHATLASAHILWEVGAWPSVTPIQFRSKHHTLTCWQEQDVVAMEYPALPPQVVDSKPICTAVAKALRATPLRVAKNESDYLVELADENAVVALQPDMQALGEFEARGVIATSMATGKSYDIVSRFFAPRLGIPEDPATGTAHCCLAPYWSSRLGKTELTGLQASSRGGLIGMRYRKDRVILLGNVSVVSAEIAHGHLS